MTLPPAVQNPLASALGATGMSGTAGGLNAMSGVRAPATNGIDALMAMLREAETPKRRKTPLEEAIFRLLQSGGGFEDLMPRSTVSPWESTTYGVPAL